MSNSHSDTHRVFGRQYGIAPGNVRSAIEAAGDQAVSEAHAQALTAAPIYLVVDGAVVAKAYNPTDALALVERYPNAGLYSSRDGAEEAELDGYCELYLTSLYWTSTYRDINRNVITLDGSELITNDVECINGPESIPQTPWGEHKKTLTAQPKE